MVLILEHCTIFDGHSEELLPDHTIVIDNGIIREIAEGSAFKGEAQRIDVGGRFVMPGLIDAHYHAYATHLDAPKMETVAPQIRSLMAKQYLEDSLQRGFTTVRDAGGGDVYLALALREGLIKGPRFFYPGLAISQTGGHGDLRAPDHHTLCACGASNTVATVVDGVDAVRAAVREQLRTGAHQIKLLVSGGVLSPSDPIWMNQLADEEIKAAVQEAATRRTYVMAHAHTNEAVLRCLNLGVRSFEHVTLLEADGAEAIARSGAFAVPTLAIVEAMRRAGEEIGLSAPIVEKIREVGDQGLAALDHLRRAGAQIAFGTDLIGPMHALQSIEFGLRRKVCSPLEILRQATSVGADLLQHSGKLGTIAPEAFADLLVLDGNPLDDITVMERHELISLIVRDGEICTDRLSKQGH